jgi:6-phosphogluconolactonase
MDEIEWWEFGSSKELAEQAAGDIGFIVESALEAHGGARLALSADADAEPVHAALAKAKGFDWSKVTVIPTDDRLVGLSDPLSRHRALSGWFGTKGAEIVSLVDEAALGDRQEAGRLADARLSLLSWPLDLALLTLGEDGHTAGIFPGPDFDRAVAGPRERRAVALRPDPMPEEAAADRITLTAAALGSARAVMVVLSGAEKRAMLEQAIKEGPLSSVPIGRVLASLDVPIDIFWSEQA